MCGPKFCSMRITEDLRKLAGSMSELITLDQPEAVVASN
jgi:hypothetical protein